MTTNFDYGRPFSEDVLIDQIGRMNFYAISGGRLSVWQPEGETVEVMFPAGAGYYIRVTLAWDDTYTVSRLFKRKGSFINKGTIEGVYCDQIGEIVYQAACWRTPNFGYQVA
jgi:hypothetical protein